MMLFDDLYYTMESRRHFMHHIMKHTSPREFGESKNRRYTKKNKKKGRK